MRLGTIIKLAALAAAALMVTLLAVVKSIDVNRYRPLLAQTAKAATGGDLVIRGPIRLHLGPTPRLTAEDVVLSSPPSPAAAAPPGSGERRRSLLTVKRITAQIGLMPLLFREISLQRLVLTEPELLLESDAAGRAAGQPAAPLSFSLPDTAAAGVPTTLHIGHLRVDKAHVVYRDGRGGRTQTLDIDRLTADADTLIAPVGLHAEGRWNGIPLDVSGVVGSLLQLMDGLRAPGHDPGKPYAVKLKAVMPALVATLDGSLTDTGAGLDDPQLSLKLTAETPELAELLHYTDTALPPLGAVRLSLLLSGRVAAPALSDLDLALGRKDNLAVTAKGRIRDLRTGQGADLLVAVEGRDLAAAGRILDLPLPPVGPLRLAGRLRDIPGGWRLSDMKAAVGHSDAAGEAAWRHDGPRPAVDLRLSSALLDLEELTAPPRGAPRGEAPGGPQGGPQQSETRNDAPRPRGGDRLFSDDPLPFALLTAIDGRLSWKVDRFNSDTVDMEKLALDGGLAGGTLTLAPVVDRLAGGRVAGRLTLDAAAAPPALSLQLEADEVELGELLRSLRLTDGLSGARTSLRLTAQGRGATPHALVSQLNGETVVIADRSRLDSAADLLRQLAPWAEAGTAEIKCLVGRFTVTDGLAKSEALLFDTGASTVSGHGSINLGKELIDLTLAPRPKEARLLSQAIPLDLGGTLLDPVVLPNRGTPVQSLAGAAGGWSLGPLAPAAAAAGANPCLAALAPAAPPPTRHPPPARGGKNSLPTGH